MNRDVCTHFNPVDQTCDQCNSETQQTLELELARHANMIRQICKTTFFQNMAHELAETLQETLPILHDGFHEALEAKVHRVLQKWEADK